MCHGDLWLLPLTTSTHWRLRWCLALFSSNIVFNYATYIVFLGKCYYTLHRLQCSINKFYMHQGKPKNFGNILSCDIHFIEVVWNKPHYLQGMPVFSKGNCLNSENVIFSSRGHFYVLGHLVTLMAVSNKEDFCRNTCWHVSKPEPPTKCFLTGRHLLEFQL